MPRAGKRCSHYHNWGRGPLNAASILSAGIPRNDPLMASFGHTFVHTLCRDATLPRDSTNEDRAPFVARLDPSGVRDSSIFFSKVDASKGDALRSTKLQIPIFAICCSFDLRAQLLFSWNGSRFILLMASHVSFSRSKTIWSAQRKFERRRIGKEEIRIRINALIFAAFRFSKSNSFSL